MNDQQQNPRTQSLSEAGVSIWLDDLSRGRIQSGELKKLVDEKSVVGVTTNPSIFQAALSKGNAYDDQVNELAARGADVDATIRTVTTDDVRNACDVMRPVYDATDGQDGRVSIEVDPRLAHDTDATALTHDARVRNHTAAGRSSARSGLFPNAAAAIRAATAITTPEIISAARLCHGSAKLTAPNPKRPPTETITNSADRRQERRASRS